MFLSKDFCMEKFLAREVTIFPEKKKKKKSSKMLSKFIKPIPNCKNTYQGSKHWNKIDKFARILS